MLEKFNRSLSIISTSHLLGIIITCGLILAIGAPRWVALNRFVTTDEILWLNRSGNFYSALVHHDYLATFQKGHPGVTVMWAGLAGYLHVYPEYSNNEIGLNTLARLDPNLPLLILVTGRRIMILLNLLSLILCFLFARHLFGVLPAMVGFLIIAFDPFHIALTRVLHLDGLLANLMLLSLISFLAHLKNHGKAALAVSAVAAGLAWLTKSPGLFLIPLFFILAFIDMLYMKTISNEVSWRKSILHYTRTLIIWSAIAVVVFCLLWPAMWMDPVGSVSKVLRDASEYAISGHASPEFFNGKIYLDGEISDPGFYPTNFLWRTTPVTLFGLLGVVILLKQTQLHDRRRWPAVVLILFALGFGVLMSLGQKKFDRYILPSIVSLDLAAGVGLVWLAGWLGKFSREKWRSFSTGVILAGFIAFQAGMACITFPYYLSFYNPLLGGSQQAPKVMQIGWGEGLDQAARYLNNKPNPDKLRVISWYANGPFSYFSKSQFIPINVNAQWSAENWQQFYRSDYVVIYIHQWQRDIPAELLDYLKNLTPEHSIWIDGLEYVRIYKIQ